MQFSIFQLPGLSHNNGFLWLPYHLYHLIKVSVFWDGWKQELDCACVHPSLYKYQHTITRSDLSTLRFESFFATNLCSSFLSPNTTTATTTKKTTQKCALCNIPYVHANPTIQNLTKIMSVKRLYKILLHPVLLCDV